MNIPRAAFPLPYCFLNFCKVLSAVVLSVGPLTAQIPSLISLLKGAQFNQVNASELQVVTRQVLITVSFASAPPSTVSVQVRTPRGETITLESVQDADLPQNTFAAFPEYSSDAELETAFPDGLYAFLVRGGATDSTTNFTSSFGAMIAPVLITNYDELQALSATTATVQWQSIPFSGGNNLLSLVIRRDGGAQIFSTPTSFSAGSRAVSVSDLPVFTPLTGSLSYTRSNVTSLTNGATRAVAARLTSVDFSLYCKPASPVIDVQPVDTVASPGDTVDFFASATGLAPLSFQWKRDGLVVFGATGSRLQISNVQASDAGKYTFEVVSPVGRVASAPALLAVSPSFKLSLFAGAPQRDGDSDGASDIARFRGLTGLAFDGVGNLYIADRGNNVIRKITPAGIVSTVAGLAGASGYVDGVGQNARFSRPMGLTADRAGIVYVADTGNHVVRKISASGVVTTVAGAGGLSGTSDGVGTQAYFNGPAGLALDAVGNLFVADEFGGTIRKITPSGVVSTFAGAPHEGGSTDGLGTAARFYRPTAIAIDASGTLYVADPGGSFFSSIRKISSGGVVTTFHVFAGHPNVRGVAVDSRGYVYAANDSGGILRIGPDGVLNGTLDRTRLEVGTNPNSVLLAAYPFGITVDFRDTVYVADATISCVLKAAFVPGSSVSGITMVTPPSPQTIVQNGSVVFSVTATGPSLVYQWRRNGVPIPGATAAQFFLPQTSTADLGTYDATVSNGVGAVFSRAAALSFAPAGAVGRLVNLSVRSRVGASTEALIVGVAISGNAAASQTKPVLVRGIGPGLVAFGVTDALSDPDLTVYRGTQVVASNDNWGGSAALGSTFTAVGAFPLASNSLDAALALSLGAGTYSVQVSGRASATGVTLAEIYDASTASGDAGATRLVNLSARAAVGIGGNALIAGFVVSGTTSRTLLIRAVGPTLQDFGVSGVLRDPVLRVFANDTPITSNDNWNNDRTLSTAFSKVGAFDFRSNLDSALLVTLPPGSYSAQVSGVGDSPTGVALIEIYEVP